MPFEGKRIVYFFAPPPDSPPTSGRMADGDPESFIATTYSVWATTKTVALYAAIIYAGQQHQQNEEPSVQCMCEMMQRFDEINSYYGSKERCLTCLTKAAENPDSVFEFGRCDREFLQEMKDKSKKASIASRSNLLRSDSGWGFTTQVSQVREYVATPSVCLALGGICWSLVVALNCMVRGNATMCISFSPGFNTLM
eukprot:jgi/Bigna1/77322/fgenesh1_pg.47_\